MLVTSAAERCLVLHRLHNYGVDVAAPGIFQGSECTWTDLNECWSPGTSETEHQASSEGKLVLGR